MIRGTRSTSVFKGAILTISMRWADRLVGFVSTLILARLLVPSDFGIIAMASLVIGLIDVFLDLGVNVALIQNRNATDAHYNTAWTLRIIQTGIGAVIVFIAAPQAAVYFKDLRITPVLQVMSAGLILVGLENIGVITFQKEMRFGLDFRFVFLKRIAGFLVTMIAAWLMRSYWALVIGTLAGRTLGVLLSYHMHPMRPSLSLEKLKEIFSVSQWMLLNSVGNYLNRNVHNMLVGRRASTAIMGGYILAGEISAMPSTEILAPLNRVLFPTFVKAKHDLVELKRLFLLAQSVQSLLGIPAGVGLALVAHEAVLVLLGEKWLFVAPFVQILALANVVEAITTSGGYVLITMGKLRYAVLITWIQVIFLSALVIFMPPGSDALQIAWLRVLTVLAGLFVLFWMLTRTLQNVSLMDIGRSILRPLLGIGVMTLAIISIEEVIKLTPLAALIVKVFTGLITYPVAIMLMWWIAKKPKGAESYLLDKVIGVLKYRRTKNSIIKES